ncbi:hypothetical protein ACIGO8_23090 [Streptomyces sp. NPDC053493]|uniref:hypothetical protein n=1 Tax=Streptomyces sp. NPDC053493 TaxID=3365705 RepID=UPI0037D60268
MASWQGRAPLEARTDGILIKTPKSATGVRTVAFPASLAESLATYLAVYAAPGRTGLVLTGARSGQMRRNNYQLMRRGAAGRGEGVSGVVQIVEVDVAEAGVLRGP